MKRLWLLFCQVTTVALALYFVIATLQPTWLGRSARTTTTAAGIAIVQAPASENRGETPATRTEGSLAAAAAQAMPAVVSITTSTQVRHPRSNDPWFQFFYGELPAQQQTGLGSGVIVSAEGYILTNNHVVEGADAIEVTLSDRRRASARIVGTDPDTDLAVLKVELDSLPLITWARTEDAAVGDRVLAIGNPFGVGQTVTSGIVSALGRNELGINTFENFIQTDAAINPGNSGGALVDINGHLLGINTAIYSRSGGSMGIGFAIPTSTAQFVLDGIARHGKVTRGWIGVEPSELTPEMAQAFGITDASVRGVLIAGVLQGGAAASAGLQPGDVVTAIADTPVTRVVELMNAIAALPPGQDAAFEVWRNGQSLSLTITPQTRPATQRRAR